MAATLLGIFASTTGTGALTTGSRTSTAGSLVTAHNGAWRNTAGISIPTATDSFTNAFTENIDLATSFGGGNSFPCLSNCHNIGGTRGASHTVSTAAVSGSTSHTLVACEWDGISGTPTIATGSNSGFTSTSGSATVSPAAPSLVVGTFCYDGTITTLAVSAPTVEAVEVDEANSFQDQNVGYKVGANGSTTLNWTIGTTRDWMAIVVSFTESGVASGYTPDLYKPYACFPKFLLRNQQRQKGVA